MKKFSICFLLLISAQSFATNLITHKSSYDFEKTKSLITSFIKNKGLKLFTVIDHAAGARNVKLDLEDNSLIIFGNPKVGTLMMNKSPLVGLELPMKVLVYAKGKSVYVSYKNIQSLKNEYGLTGLDPVFKKVSTLFKVIGKTVKK